MTVILRRLARLFLTGLILAGSVAGVDAGERPTRVVSLNLCADQLLLRLADPTQIASLSPLSRDPALSFLADAATAIPQNDGKGESILFAGSDLVLTGTFGQRARTALLERQGFAVQTVEPWRSLAHGREQIRLVAARLGQAARGEALIAEIDDALALSANAAGSGLSILTYYRRGWVPASDSLVSEILRHLGFIPHQATLGVTRGGVVRLETIVSSPPDFLMMDPDALVDIDHGSALLVHPALARAVPAARRLLAPNRLSICGGPSTPVLIRSLAAQAAAAIR